MKLETPPPAPPLEGRGVPAGSLAEFQVADKAAAAPLREMILAQNARQLFTDPTPSPSP